MYITRNVRYELCRMNYTIIEQVAYTDSILHVKHRYTQYKSSALSYKIPHNCQNMKLIYYYSNSIQIYKWQVHLMYTLGNKYNVWNKHTSISQSTVLFSSASAELCPLTPLRNDRRYSMFLIISYHNSITLLLVKTPTIILITHMQIRLWFNKLT